MDGTNRVGGESSKVLLPKWWVGLTNYSNSSGKSVYMKQGGREIC